MGEVAPDGGDDLPPDEEDHALDVRREAEDGKADEGEIADPADPRGEGDAGAEEADGEGRDGLSRDGASRLAAPREVGDERDQEADQDRHGDVRDVVEARRHLGRLRDEPGQDGGGGAQKDDGRRGADEGDREDEEDRAREEELLPLLPGGRVDLGDDGDLLPAPGEEGEAAGEEDRR